jgi:hypothetical protein
MARRRSLNKRSMTPAQWRMPFWEDPMYPFAQRPDSTINATADLPNRPVAPKSTKVSWGRLKARYRSEE